MQVTHKMRRERGNGELPTIIENDHLATILRDEPREIYANNRHDDQFDKNNEINFICTDIQT